MPTVTGVADSNGDFNIAFGANYTSAEKITVTATKDGASKSIELHAPSDVVGGGVIQFSGTLDNFPNNIGNVLLSQISGVINSYCFAASSNALSIWRVAKGLTINAEVTGIGYSAFGNWVSSTKLEFLGGAITLGDFAFTDWYGMIDLELKAGLNLTLGASTFQSWTQAKFLRVYSNVSIIPASCFSNWQQLLTAEFPATVTSFANNACSGWAACNEITVRSVTPPAITATTFSNLKSTCIFKVPAASVAAYQAAANWSAFASRIQAI